jgi:hypothetical protein
MGVVSAGVSFAGVLGGVLRTAGFFERERVDVGTQRDVSARSFALKHCHGVSFKKWRSYVKLCNFAETGTYLLTGLELFSGKLRYPVESVPEAGDFRHYLLQYVVDIFHQS